MANLDPKSYFRGMYASKLGKHAAEKHVYNESLDRIATREKQGFHLSWKKLLAMSKDSYKPMVETDPRLVRAIARAAENQRKAGLVKVFEEHHKAVARDIAKVAPAVASVVGNLALKDN